MPLQNHVSVPSSAHFIRRASTAPAPAVWCGVHASLMPASRYTHPLPTCSPLPPPAPHLLEVCVQRNLAGLQQPVQSQDGVLQSQVLGLWRSEGVDTKRKMSYTSDVL